MHSLYAAAAGRISELHRSAAADDDNFTVILGLCKWNNQHVLHAIVQVQILDELEYEYLPTSS